MNRRRFSNIKLPIYRDSATGKPLDWIQRKKNSDNIGNLWRVHDSLYDFTDFIPAHPGGAQWIALSRGTDITEAFEIHHLRNSAGSLLSNYFIKSADSPRATQFTFKDDGFYKTLKPKIIAKLSEVPKNVRKKSVKIVDSLFLTVLVLGPLSCWFWSLNAIVGSLFIILNSVALGFLVTCAHNYFHRADNWRMFLFNLNGLSFEDWRITHSLSHHIFTNTCQDAELRSFEPYLQYIPYKDKSIWSKSAFLYWPFVGLSLCLTSLITGVFQKRTQRNPWAHVIPFFLPIWMFLFGGQPLLVTVAIWICTCLISSLSFTVFGLTSGHLNSDNFFEGQNSTDESIDWGLHQLRTVVERSESSHNQFKALTMFGDHLLHHLFPTLDHGELQYLYPVLLEHCEEFGVQLRTTNFCKAMYDQAKQLTSQS